jgi:hypothetical protein
MFLSGQDFSWECRGGQARGAACLHVAKLIAKAKSLCHKVASRTPGYFRAAVAREKLNPSKLVFEHRSGERRSLAVAKARATRRAKCPR